MNKATLRQRFRGARRALDTGEHARRSRAAAHAIAGLAAFRCGAKVAVYLPFDREADTSDLSRAARRRRVRLYVPVISDLRHRRLEFVPLSTRTRRGRFGISVPRRNGRATPPRWLDLIVVPLVGIDGHGRRLGMGGGFYDRALQFRRTRHRWMGPLLVGLGFDCQFADSIHAEEWDVRLDVLATESGLRYFREDTP